MLGMNVTDKISGLTGTVTGFVRYITGCNQALVQPKGDGSKLPEPCWIDEQRLNINKNVSAIILDNSKTPGFGRAPPVR